MLRACMLDFASSWDTHLHLIEFSYNNSYQAIREEVSIPSVLEWCNAKKKKKGGGLSQLRGKKVILPLQT